MTTTATAIALGLKAKELQLIAALPGLISIDKIERRSERLYDLSISGEKSYDGGNAYRFSAWLPLAALQAIRWERYAGLSDYPELVRQGDWSGIRDSEPASIWRMLELAEHINELPHQK